MSAPIATAVYLLTQGFCAADVHDILGIAYPDVLGIAHINGIRLHRGRRSKQEISKIQKLFPVV